MARLTLILGVLATVVYLLDGFRFMLNEWRNWRNKSKWLVVVGLCLMPSVSQATIYYISTSGADTNNGLTTSTPFAHAPGMQVCTNTCASTTPVAGDRFILKGGDTWTNANFSWSWTWSGSAGNLIYIGNDGTFGTGRPILSAGGSVMTTQNCTIWMAGNYTQWDNFEFTGLQPTTGIFGEDCHINPRTSTNFIISQNYAHGWNEDGTNDTGIFVAANTAYPSIHTNAIFELNVIDGSDTTSVVADLNCTGACKGSLVALFGSIPTVRYNVFRYLVNGPVGAFDRTYGNVFSNSRDSIAALAHENYFLNNRTCGAWFYNNLIQGNVSGGSFNGTPTGFAEEVSCTGYIFNNVWSNAYGSPPIAIDLPTPYASCTPDARGLCQGGSYVVLNNTIECGLDASPSSLCVNFDIASSLGYHSQDGTVKNNHFITSTGDPIGCRDVANFADSCTESNQVQHTKAQANTQGYTSGQTYPFSPTDSLDDTVNGGAGADLTATYCGTIPELCSDSPVGVSYDATAHTVSYPFRTRVARPNGSIWNVGAYQYANTAISASVVVRIIRYMEVASTIALVGKGLWYFRVPLLACMVGLLSCISTSVTASWSLSKGLTKQGAVVALVTFNRLTQPRGE